MTDRVRTGLSRCEECEASAFVFEGRMLCQRHVDELRRHAIPNRVWAVIDDRSNNVLGEFDDQETAEAMLRHLVRVDPEGSIEVRVSSMTPDATRNREAELRQVLEAAVDEAWARYKDRAGFQDSSAPYREGFADGLERALLIFDRWNGEPDA